MNDWRTMFSPNLEELDLSGNQFYGRIPGSLANCPLKTMYLNHNYFEGIDKGVTSLVLQENDLKIMRNLLPLDELSGISGWLANYHDGSRRWENQKSRNVLYVSSSAPQNGDGNNWGTAFNNLHQALEEHQHGDVIKIAKGEYSIFDKSGESGSFIFKGTTTIYGGYQVQDGKEIERDPAKHPTVLLRSVPEGSETGNVSSDPTVVAGYRVRIDGITFKGAGPQQSLPETGAGLYAQRADSVILERCTFSDNYAGLNGGALALDDCRGIEFDYCVFDNNGSTDDYSGPSGGAVALFQSEAAFRNSLMFNNPDGGIWIAGDKGMGIPLDRTTLTNCTFASNGLSEITADNPGGCITMLGSGSGLDATITNCIFWNEGTAVYTDRGFLDAGFCITQEENNAFVLADPAFSSINLTEISHGDPLFVDPAGLDYRLANATSSAVDAGKPETDTTGWGIDLTGLPRLRNYRIDIGCHEFVEPMKFYVDKDAAGDGRGTSWSNAFPTMADAIFYAYADDTIWVAEGKYFCSEKVIHPLSLYGGFAGTETSLEQRVLSMHPCTLTADIDNDDVIEYTYGPDGEEIVLEELKVGTKNASDVLNISFDRLGKSNAIVDGFVIIGAYYDGLDIDQYQGDVNFTLSNCVLSHNGTGLDADGLTNLSVVNCSFSWQVDADVDTYVYQMEILGSRFHISGDRGIDARIEENMIVDRCRFERRVGSDQDPMIIIDNYAEIVRSKAHITNSLFSYIDNTAVDIQGSEVYLNNCTFLENGTDQDAAPAVFVTEDADVRIENTVIWNRASGEAKSIDINFGLLSVSHSNIQGSGGSGNTWDTETFGQDLGGNIDTDPEFISTGTQPGIPSVISPCIDAGDPTTDITDMETDLLGNDRVRGERIDMGCYEFPRYRVKPILSSVENECDGTMTVTWNYNNRNSTAIEVPVGEANSFSEVADRGQPVTFDPGIHEDVFSVTVSEDRLSWMLEGTTEVADISQAPSGCLGPQFTSKLRDISVEAGKRTEFDLCAKELGVKGVYVSWEYGDIADLTWSVSQEPSDVNIAVVEPCNTLSIEPGTGYVPGDRFAFVIEAADNIHTGLSTKLVVSVTVTSAGFTICDANAAQDEYGTVRGTVKSGRHSGDLVFSQDRVYLYEGQITNGRYNRDVMLHLRNVTLTRVSKPLSMGGEEECGEYTFTVAPASDHLFLPGGDWSGSTLREYLLGTDYFDGQLRLLLPMATPYDHAQFRLIEIPVDFDGPTVNAWVCENEMHSQKLCWEKFTPEDEVVSLRLFIEPLGANAPAKQVIDLSDMLPDISSHKMENLQDSRLYHYTLRAIDKKGNARDGIVEKETPSDLYTISGVVGGKFDPANHECLVHLASVVGEGIERMVQTTTAGSDHSYEFNGVVNGSYVVRPVSMEYSAMPVEQEVELLREDVTGLNFLLSPDPLLNRDAMKVTQIEESGDLRFTAKTDAFLEGETVKAVRLKWVSGYPGHQVTGEQMIEVDDAAVQNTGDGTANVAFTIDRATIEDRILSRTSSFDWQVRYVDAELITSTPSYTTFRVGTWDYPVARGAAQYFAPQCFRKPAKPLVGSIMTSQDELAAELVSFSPGLSCTAFVEVTNMVTGEVSHQKLDVSHSFTQQTKNYSGGFLLGLDWQFTSATRNDDEQHQYLSGYVQPSANGSFTPSGGLYPARPSFPKTLETPAWAEWQLLASMSDEYIVWACLEDLPLDGGDVYFSIFDKDGNETKHKGVIEPQASKGWVRIFPKPRFLVNPVPLSVPGGLNTFRWYFTSSEISISAIALSPVHRGKGGKIENVDEPPGNLIESPIFGTGNMRKNVSIGSLDPDHNYHLRAYVKDRYGNTSDDYTDWFDTKDNFYLRDFVVFQEEEYGDFVITIQPPGGAEHLPSHVTGITLKLQDNTSYEIDVDVLLETGPKGLKTFRMPREMLGEEILNSESFRRHPRYEVSMISFSKKAKFEIDQCVTIARPAMDGSYGQTVPSGAANCDETITVYTSTISEYDATFSWPQIDSDYHAAQQYTPVNAPHLAVEKKEQNRIVFRPINLHRNADGSINRQMAGTVHAKWKPGSLCADSTEMDYPFGNRFGMDENGWIAFRPNFEASLHGTVGKWRYPVESGKYGIAHQWLDKWDEADDPSAGGFYPNKGFVVDVEELANPIQNKVPSLSMGIRLEEDEGSVTEDAGEMFRLWVLPHPDNTQSNSTFYWGVDGVPITEEYGNAFPPDGDPATGWIGGPTVHLESGDHTIDIFMREDGTSISGIALAKVGQGIPAFTASELDAWGTEGFDVVVDATDLPADEKFEFTVDAIDRYGNVSPVVTEVFRTPEPGEAIPALAFEARSDLEAGLFATGRPSLALRLTEDYDKDLIDPELRLVKVEEGVVTERDIDLIIDEEAKDLWGLFFDDGEILEDHPEEGRISSLNAYRLYARARDAAGNAGPWSYLEFGVRSGFNRARVAVLDPEYTIGNLKLRYIAGHEENDVLIGDMEVVWSNDEIQAEPRYRLTLEGATLETETDETDFTKITGISGGQWRARSYTLDFRVIESQGMYAVNYGRYTIDLVTDMISLNQTDGVLEVGEAYIVDDRGGFSAIAGNAESTQPIRIDSDGIVAGATADFWIPEDYFFMENVVSWGYRDGFGIEACVARFYRSPGEEKTAFSIEGMGDCPTCGPKLKFEVTDPRYGDEAFTVYDNLDKAASITYYSDDYDYILDDKLYLVEKSSLHDDEVFYDNWRMRLSSYRFDKTGVLLTDFAVGVVRDRFPRIQVPHGTFEGREVSGGFMINDNDRFIQGFSGARIEGDPEIAGGALRIFGPAEASGTDVALTTRDYYTIKNVGEFQFRDASDNPGGDYYILTRRGDEEMTLVLPTTRQDAFEFDGAKSADGDLEIPLYECELDNETGIRRLLAVNMVTGSYRDRYNGPAGEMNGLLLQGMIVVENHDRVCNVTISENNAKPKNERAILRLQNGFVDNVDKTVYIPGSSIAFKNDFSIYSVYGMYAIANHYPEASFTAQEADHVTFTTGNIFVEQRGDDELRLRLGTPKLKLAPFGSSLGGEIIQESGAGPEAEAHSVVMTFGKRLIHAGVDAKMPEDMRSISGIPAVGADIAGLFGNVTVNGLRVRYLRDTRNRQGALDVGLDGSVTFGDLFKYVGLKDKSVYIEDLTMQKLMGPGGEKLGNYRMKSLTAVSSPSNQTYTISEHDLTGHGSRDPIVLMSTAPSALKLEYLCGGCASTNAPVQEPTEEENNIVACDRYHLTVNGLSVATTDKFPLRGLRNISIALDRLEYISSPGCEPERVVKIAGQTEIYREELQFSDKIKLIGARITLSTDADEPTTCGEPLCGEFDPSRFNLFLQVSFDDVEVEGSRLNTSASLRAYLNGDIEWQMGIENNKKIAVYPFGAEPDEAEIFVAGAREGNGFAPLKFCFKVGRCDGDVQIEASVGNAWIYSKGDLAGLDRPLEAGIQDLTVAFEDGKIRPKSFRGKMNNLGLEKEVGPFNAELSYLAVGLVEQGYPATYEENGQTQDMRARLGEPNNALFYLDAGAELWFAASGSKNVVSCNAGIEGGLTFSRVYDKSRATGKLTLDWDVREGTVDCWIAGAVRIMASGISLSNNQVRIDNAMLDMAKLQDVLTREKTDHEAGAKAAVAELNKTIPNANFSVNQLGIVATGLTWQKSDDGWAYTNGAFTPLFSSTVKADIAGNTVQGEVDFARIFDKDHPGIYINDISMKLNEKLGGNEVNTGMDIFIDGYAPYVHPQPGLPGKITVAIPSIKLTDEITIGDALMEVGVETYVYPDDHETKAGEVYEEWYCRGMATMSLPPAIKEMSVDLALVRPHPWENVTGIKHAKLTIKLDKSCRIPLGTTPFYISGFFGALYDGLGQPEGAIACNIGQLPPGLKMEARIYLEFEDPAALNGNLGFWVQLTELGFGLNGEVVALEGIVHANACAALFNGGKNFHAEMNVYVNIAIQIKGDFVMDVWHANNRANMSGEANAKIGLKRALFVDRRFLKIPRKNRWVGPFFTQFGQFQDNNKGFLTGVRIVGRSYGMGIINRRFRIGNVGKYKLAKPTYSGMGKRRLAKAAAIDQGSARVGIEPVETGITLEGGEMVTILGAVSSAQGFDWKGDDLLFAVDGAPLYSGYVEPEPGDDPADLEDPDYLEETAAKNLNYFVRTWENTEQLAGSRLQVMLPVVTEESGLEMDYEVHTSLMVPRVDVKASTIVENDSLKVVLNGTIDHFRGTIREIVVDGETAMKQKMRLKLAWREQYPRNSARPYLGSYIEIPWEEFDGADRELHSSLLDNAAVSQQGEKLVLSDLKWPVIHGRPGVFDFGASVEILDYLTTNEAGEKVVLNEGEKAEAMVHKDSFTVIMSEQMPEQYFSVKVRKEDTRPLEKVTGFTATGSHLTENWQGDDESRTLFLRWEPQDIPALSGYRIEWQSTQTPNAKVFSTVVGKSGGHHALHFPATADLYYSGPCENMNTKAYDWLTEPEYVTGIGPDGAPFRVLKTEGEHDLSSGQILPKMCGKFPLEMFDSRFDVRIIPLAEEIVVTKRKHGAVSPLTGEKETTEEEYTYRERKFMAREDLAAELQDMALGRTAVADGKAPADPPRNRFTMEILDEKGVPLADKVIEAPLQLGGKAEIELNVADFVNDDVHPANYAELRAVVASFEGFDGETELSDKALPTVGVPDNFLQVTSPQMVYPISFTPRTETVTCRDMYDNAPDVDCRACEDDLAENEKKLTDEQREERLFGLCGKEGDSTLVEQSPFGLYKVYIYALNNGFRGTPVRDEAPGHAVYDSVTFRVTPPEPVLQNIDEPYITPDKVNHSITLRASRLWRVGENDGPMVRIIDDAGNDITDAFEYQPTIAPPRDEDMLFFGGEEYVIKGTVNTVGLNNRLPNHTTRTIRFFLVNRSSDSPGAVTVSSDTMSVPYLHNVQEIGCPDNALHETTLNRRFAMSFIGHYPSTVFPGQKITCLFSELLDLDPSMYAMQVYKEGTLDTLECEILEVGGYGLIGKVPEDNRIKPNETWTVRTKILIHHSIFNCQKDFFDQNINIVPKRKYRIEHSGNRFWIELESGSTEDLDKDVIRYVLDDLDGRQKVINHNPPEKRILDRTAMVYAIVYDDRTQEPWDTLQARIEVTRTSSVTGPDGTEIADGSIVRPGDELRVSPVTDVPANIDPSASSFFRIYYFGDKVRHTLDSIIVVGPYDKGPLTIETWEILRTPGGEIDTVLNHVVSLDVIVDYLVPAARIPVPPSALSLLGDGTLIDYPLLVKLDSEKFREWDVAETDGFYFRGPSGRLLPADIEYIDWDNRELAAWVLLDTLDPSAGPHYIEIVTGNAAYDSTDVWRSRYNAVWHHGDNPLVDATGNGHTLAVDGPLTAVPGIGRGAGGYGAARTYSTDRPGSGNDAGLTLSAWVWLEDLSRLDPAGTRLVGSDGACVLDLFPDGSVRFTLGNESVLSPAGVLHDRVWLPVVATYDRNDAGETVVYVAGTPVVSTGLNYGNPVPWSRGGEFAVGGGEFPGYIDEVRVAGAAAHADRLRADYVTQRPERDFLAEQGRAPAVSSLVRPRYDLRRTWSKGNAAYMDDPSWRILERDNVLSGMTLLRPLAVDGDREGDSLHVFAVDSGITLFAALDAGAAVPEAFDGWRVGGLSVALQRKRDGFEETVSMSLRSRTFLERDTVALPAPGTNAHNYLLFVEYPEPVIRFDAEAPRSYLITRSLQEGDLVYPDRPFTLESVPASLSGALCFGPADGYRSSENANFAALTVGRDVRARLLVDAVSGTIPPEGEWSPTGLRAQSSRGAYDIYESKLPRGSHTFSGPGAGGSMPDNGWLLALATDTAAEFIRRVEPSTDIVPFDTGVVLYRDEEWIVESAPELLRGMLLVRTTQADYASDLHESMEIELNHAARLFILLDTAQSLPPAFMNDTLFRELNLRVKTDAPGAYRVYKKSVPAGSVVLDGARSGGEWKNSYNYAVLIDTSRLQTVIDADRPLARDFGVGDTLWPDQNVVVRSAPVILHGRTVVVEPFKVWECDTIRLSVSHPVRLALAIDPAYERALGRLQDEGWKRRDEMVEVNVAPYERVLLEKDFEAGAIHVGGMGCFGYSGAVHGLAIFIEPRDFNPAGLYARNLRVRGMGDERSAESESYYLRDLDVAYAIQHGMRSASWHMNVNASGATTSDDTVRVLTVEGDTALVSIDDRGGKTVYTLNKQARLAELMPHYLKADSVYVDAKSLKSEGWVEVVMSNRSAVHVEDSFAIVLFEDTDNDYQYSSGIDRFIGRGFTKQIFPWESIVYQIPIDRDLTFPGRVLFAFIDAERWVDEINEFNNVVRGPTSCEGYTPPPFVVDRLWHEDTLLAGIAPRGAEGVLCRLRDTDGDTAITESDSVYFVYAYAAELYAVGAADGFRRFGPIALNGEDVEDLLVDDMTGDGIPEIVAGNLVLDARGHTLWNVPEWAAAPRDTVSFSFDMNRDGDFDVVGREDSCVTVRSGRDGGLLYAYPFERWRGRQDESTVGVLAWAERGRWLCYDVNISYPRIDTTGSDTLTATLRIGNTGASNLPASLEVAVFGVRADGDTVLCTRTTVERKIFSGAYADVTTEEIAVAGIERLSAVVEHRNRIVDITPRDNRLEIWEKENEEKNTSDAR